MKKLTMSVAVSAIVASGAFGASLEDAFAHGKISGEIGAYHNSTSNSGGNADTGYSMSSVSLNYATESINGFKGSLGFMSNHLFDEKTDVYDSTAPKSIMNIANISYSNDMGTLIVGKQAIDLEWIADYHEAVVGVVSAIPNTTIILGHTERINTSANDGALEEFHVNPMTEKGANVLDVSYAIDDTTKVGAYYMDAPDVFSAVGAIVEAEVAGLGIVAKYAQTSEDAANTPDGSIMALDLGYSIGEIALNGGYIKVGKDNGIGSLGALGDNISLFDNGDKVYGGSSTDDDTGVTSRIKDTSTFYVGASTDTNVVDVTVASSTKEKESELNLTASWECKFVKNLAMSALYANISAEDGANDNSYYSLQVAYSF